MKETKTKAASISRLALLAVGNKEAALLWMMVDRFMADDFIIGVAATADIAILDGDADGFAGALAGWQADRPGAPAVVLRSAPVEETTGVVNIAKPLAARELASVLNRLRAAAVVPAPQAPAASRQLVPPSLPAPLPRFVERTTVAETGMLSVDICMSLDNGEVLDSIGLATDASGSIRYPFSPAASPRPQLAV
jgi:hypothetical protein